MKIISKLLLMFLFTIVSGCESKEPVDTTKKVDQTKKTIEEAKEMQPKIFRGMYSHIDNKINLLDCDSKKEYLVSQSGENGNVERVYSAIIKSDSKAKTLYVETEGFTSVQEKQTGKGFDSVLIITKLVKFDPSLNCK